MRVALVTEDFHPLVGGVPEHVRNLQHELFRAGHDAIVITSRVPGYDREEPFVERVGTGRVVYHNGAFANITVGLGVSRRLAGLLRTSRCDIVHVHQALVPTLGLLAPPAAHRLGIPVVATFHTWFPRSLGFHVFRRTLQKRLDRFAAAIAVSPHVVEAMGRYFEAPWIVIPNGINLDVFHPDGTDSRANASPGPMLLFLGRLDPRNGLQTALAALPQVIEHFPTTHFVVAGDGPLRGFYERRARRLGVDVRFLGSVYEERGALYRAADVYLCPTTRASFGVTLLEAMACGTPLIVSDIPAFRTLLGSEDRRLLVPPDDPSAWAEAIISLLQDGNRRQKIRAEGPGRVQSYAWPVVARRVFEVYERVLAT